jgi:hypothetical protein
MANKISFCRSYPLEILIKKRDMVQAHFFQLTVGLYGKVELDSGMSVSLRDMDQWVNEILLKCQSAEFESEAEFLKNLNLELTKKGSIDTLKLQSENIKILFAHNKCETEYFHHLHVKISGRPRDFKISSPLNSAIQLSTYEFTNFEVLCASLKSKNISSVVDPIDKIEVRL